MTHLQIHKPNFFILGAGRSGSTYLYALLRQHPDIFLTSIKEPTFFCKPFQVIKNPIDYYGLYDQVTYEAIRGEASHAYLSNPSTAGILKALFPEARFVVILRNPADRAYSLYHWMRRYGFEYLNSFEAALKAEESRYKSAYFKRHCPQYFFNSLYFRSGLYGKQLSRYFEIFSKDQFYIVKHEDFITDPVNHLKEIFRFLEIDQNFIPNLEVDRNEGSVTTRFPGIHYIVNTQLKWLGKVRKVSMKYLKKVNMQNIEPMSQKTRNSLLDKYSPDLDLLLDMTGISF